MKDARALLAKLLTEQDDLRAKVSAATSRLAQVDDAIAAVRVLLGEAPPRKVRTSQATGTKAVILDVLSDGKRRRAADIAEAAKVELSALRGHLKDLVRAGDVRATGHTQSRTYGID